MQLLEAEAAARTRDEQIDSLKSQSERLCNKNVALEKKLKSLDELVQAIDHLHALADRQTLCCKHLRLATTL